MIDKAGIYSMPMAEYQADPVVVPSLSSGLAHILLTQSPAHAWHASQRLNPGYVAKEKEVFDLGTAAHTYILEGEAGFEVLDFPDWRTKAARESRDAARAEGKLPILAHRWVDVQAMAIAAERQLAAFEDAPQPFTDGRAEEVLIWQAGKTWCRARLDWFHSDHRTVDDLKTLGGSASPDVLGRTLDNSGWDIQAAFYMRGVKALFATEPVFRFICIENTAPYALSVIALDPAALELADRKVRRALSLWEACQESGHWPAYPTRTCYVEPTPWAEARLMERELREEGIRDDGRPIGEVL